MRQVVTTICCLALFGLTGCGAPHSQVSGSLAPANDSSNSSAPLYDRTARNSLPSVGVLNPTAVEITRPKHGQLKSLDVTVRDVAVTRQLYSDLKSLGIMPKELLCPMDSGILYHLTFMSGNHVVLKAVADPGGCQAIQLSTGQVLWGVEQKGKPFWTLLAKCLGMASEGALVAE